MKDITRQELEETYKKNLGSPLHTALMRASRSDGDFGMGLQNAKGSDRLSSPVRYKWCAVIVPAGLG